MQGILVLRIFIVTLRFAQNLLIGTEIKLVVTSEVEIALGKHYSERRDFIKTDLMGFSYLLSPKSKAGADMPNSEKTDVIEKLKNYIGIYYPNTLVEGVQCVKELISFLKGWTITWSDPTVELYASMEPTDYWGLYGSKEFPLLATIAIRIFSCPTSSASSERVWSVYSFIHTKKRNRLGNEKVGKLAYIYVNSSLLDEHDKKYYEDLAFE